MKPSFVIQAHPTRVVAVSIACLCNCLSDHCKATENLEDQYVAFINCHAIAEASEQDAIFGRYFTVYLGDSGTWLRYVLVCGCCFGVVHK